MTKYSFPKKKIKILLLEGIHPAAVEHLNLAQYPNIECISDALEGDELRSRLSDVHVLGIRSKTQLQSDVFEHARHLLAVGCFCIGTNQVDLHGAQVRGVPVFNAPFSNTRSVAELAMAEIVMLARRASERSADLHRGVWRKSAAGCFEVRHKTIGIIGYGHIGPQVGLLAESFGMEVQFFDIAAKLPLGKARQVASLAELLKTSDFVTLHVPETPETKGMFGAAELELMKPGSYVLNLSRGTVVNIPALANALRSGHIAGAAIDVFPEEPAGNEQGFVSELCGMKNVILTPHIGGSTEEAQRNIGIEVAAALIKYIDTGATSGAVNFPNVDLPQFTDAHRLLNIHRNIPGVLGEINGIIAEMGVNISGQYLGTSREIGYLIMDVGKNISREVRNRIDALDASIKTRLLF